MDFYLIKEIKTFLENFEKDFPGKVNEKDKGELLALLGNLEILLHIRRFFWTVFFIVATVLLFLTPSLNVFWYCCGLATAILIVLRIIFEYLMNNKSLEFKIFRKYSRLIENRKILIDENSSEGLINNVQKE